MFPSCNIYVAMYVRIHTKLRLSLRRPTLGEALFVRELHHCLLESLSSRLFAVEVLVDMHPGGGDSLDVSRHHPGGGDSLARDHSPRSSLLVGNFRAHFKKIFSIKTPRCRGKKARIHGDRRTDGGRVFT
jgi:hypothetical protein